MKKSSSLLLATLALGLAACTRDPVIPTNGDTSSEGSETSTISETRNVLFQGTLEEAGVNIFMQGTHQLTLPDGRFILLESESINLNDYINMNVEVFGSVRPTVEAGGQIMRVESVRSLEATTESSASSTATAESSQASSEAAITSTASVAAASSTAQAQSSVAATTVGGSNELTAKAALMAKDNMDVGQWTQKYCSTHIGFCVPVHKNWWYKSFGATTTSFWHVEIGPSEMNNLGEGPITISLVSGASTADKQVTVENGTVVGTRTWTGNRHFEIRGPASLETAVRYLTEQLVSAGN